MLSYQRANTQTNRVELTFTRARRERRTRIKEVMEKERLGEANKAWKSLKKTTKTGRWADKKDRRQKIKPIKSKIQPLVTKTLKNIMKKVWKEGEGLKIRTSRNKLIEKFPEMKFRVDCQISFQTLT